MNRKISFLVLICLSLTFAGRSQFVVGATTDKNGSISVRAGLAYLTLAEITANYSPEFLNKSGFIGGSVKAPVKLGVLSDYYTSQLYWGFFLNYTAGYVYFPAAPTGSLPLSSNKKFGSAPSMSIEISWAKSGFGVSLPIEVGYGKLNFNQEFEKQYNATENRYDMKNNLFISTGLKFYFSEDLCDRATRGLKIGY